MIPVDRNNLTLADDSLTVKTNMIFRIVDAQDNDIKFNSLFLPDIPYWNAFINSALKAEENGIIIYECNPNWPKHAIINVLDYYLYRHQMKYRNISITTSNFDHIYYIASETDDGRLKKAVEHFLRPTIVESRSKKRVYSAFINSTFDSLGFGYDITRRVGIIGKKELVFIDPVSGRRELNTDAATGGSVYLEDFKKTASIEQIARRLVDLINTHNELLQYCKYTIGFCILFLKPFKYPICYTLDDFIEFNEWLIE